MIQEAQDEELANQNNKEVLVITVPDHFHPSIEDQLIEPTNPSQEKEEIKPHFEPDFKINAKNNVVKMEDCSYGLAGTHSNFALCSCFGDDFRPR